MSGNQAIRAQVKMVMADGGKPAGLPDELVTAVVRQTLQSIGIDEVGDEHRGPAAVGDPGVQLDGSAALIGRETLRAAQRVEALEAVADAAGAYRKSVRKGKGKKAARANLFEAVAMRKASQ
ncbi:MAG: hypothetical protein IVW52_16455 [Acidimicrobiales bacterium]|nr:hypothetical protein [Acidimicrobiales bacterium]